MTPKQVLLGYYRHLINRHSARHESPLKLQAVIARLNLAELEQRMWGVEYEPQVGIAEGIYRQAQVALRFGQQFVLTVPPGILQFADGFPQGERLSDSPHGDERWQFDPAEVLDWMNKEKWKC